MRSFIIEPFEKNCTQGIYTVGAKIKDLDNGTHKMVGWVEGDIGHCYQILQDLVAHVLRDKLHSEIEAPPKCPSCTKGYICDAEGVIHLCPHPDCYDYAQRGLLIGDSVETSIQIESDREFIVNL